MSSAVSPILLRLDVISLKKSGRGSGVLKLRRQTSRLGLGEEGPLICALTVQRRTARALQTKSHRSQVQANFV